MRALRITVLAFTVTLVASIGGRAGASPAPATAREAPAERPSRRDLARENARLRAENRALRQRLRTFEDRGITTVPAPTRPRIDVQSPPRQEPRVPSNWVPREINGLRFYVIPLSQPMI